MPKTALIYPPDHYVFVNERLEYDHGRLAGEKAGRPLRGPGWARRSMH